VISVSEAYLATLRQRYSWFGEDQGSVLTFGAPDSDFELARRSEASSRPLLPPGPRIRIAYAGRLGGDMLPALEVLFAGLTQNRATIEHFEIHFFGTSYAGAGKGTATTTGLARRYGLEAIVHETPARIGYVDSLRLLLETDIAILFGSSDRDYSPSKLYPTLLAARPTLAIAPRGSVLAARVTELGGALLVEFEPNTIPDSGAVENVACALAGFSRDRSWNAPPANLAMIGQKYSAAAVAIAQLEVFNAVISRRHSRPGHSPGADSVSGDSSW
jgi:hypothetical protein